MGYIQIKSNPCERKTILVNEIELNNSRYNSLFYKIVSIIVKRFFGEKR